MRHVAQIDSLLQRALESGASDLHLRAGAPPLIRLHGRLQPLSGVENSDGYEAALLAHPYREPAADFYNRATISILPMKSPAWRVFGSISCANIEALGRSFASCRAAFVPWRSWGCRRWSTHSPVWNRGSCWSLVRPGVANPPRWQRLSITSTRRATSISSPSKTPWSSSIPARRAWSRSVRLGRIPPRLPQPCALSYGKILISFCSVNCATSKPFRWRLRRRRRAIWCSGRCIRAPRLRR